MLVPTDEHPPPAVVDQSRAEDVAESVAAAAAHQQHFARKYLPRLYANDVSLTHLMLTDSMCRDVSVTALADALRVNTTLLVLQLEDNLLTDDGLAKLADVVRHNSTLVQIHLDGNNFSDDGVMALAKAAETNFVLTKVSLDRNATTLSPSTLEAMDTIVRLNERPPALKKLVLRVESGERPTSIDLSFIGAPPTSPEEREHLLLDDFCAFVLADVMRKAPSLAELKLANNMIADDGAAALASAVEAHELIHEIDLANNLVTDRGVRALTSALTANNSLQRLNVMGCLAAHAAVIDLELALLVNTQPPRIKMFLPRIADNDQRLYHLELDDHESLRFYDDVSVTLVTSLLQTSGNSRLVSLCMTHGKIGAAGAVAFSRFLKRFPVSPSVTIDEPLANLRVLDLSYNPDVGPHTHHIADALLKNATLQSLNLAACNVTDAAASAFASMLEENTTLTQLDLSHNSLIADAGAHFAYTFNVNHTLTDFSLENTGVSRKVLASIQDHRQAVGEPEELQQVLPNIFESNERFTEVRLNGDTDIHSRRRLQESSARLLAQPLANNFVVRYVDISNNEINFDGMTAIFNALQQNRVTLTYLDVSNNPIGHGSIFGRMVASVIAAHTALTELNINDTGLTTEGARGIISELDVPRCNSLKVLHYGGSDQIAPVVRNHLDLLLACNSHHPCLKQRLRTVLRNWQSDAARGIDTKDVDMDAFAVAGDSEFLSVEDVDAMVAISCRFLSIVPTIESVSLKRNGFGDGGAKSIAEWLKTASACHSVYLNGNQIESAGVAALAQAVRVNYTVRTLQVSRDPTLEDTLADRPEDAAALDEALIDLNAMLHYNEQPESIKQMLVGIGNNTVTSIDESHRVQNHLVDAHVRLIVKEMASNSTLRSINLSNNYITAEGLEMLLTVARNHPALEAIVLRNTLVNGDVQLGAHIASLLERTATLRTLDLSYCDFSDDFIPPILRALEVNQSVRCIGLQDAGIATHLERAVNSRVSLNSEQRLKAIAARLREDDPTFTEFCIPDSGFFAEQVVEAAQALDESTHVVSVDLSGNGITDGRVLDGLINNVSVTSISVANNNLDAAVVGPLCQLLRRHPVLRTIDLRDNASLTAAVLEPLLEVVSETDTVVGVLVGPSSEHDVILRDKEHPLHFTSAFRINLSPTIKAALQRVRENDPNLKTIDTTSDPEVTDVAVEMLMDAADTNTHLTTLKLPGGSISDHGVQLLGNVIVERRVLTHLDLSGNAVTDDGTATLAGVLQVNDTLRYLNLRGNRVTEAGAAKIARACESNDTLLRCIISDDDVRDNLLLEPFDTPVKDRQQRHRKARAAELDEKKEIARRAFSQNEFDEEAAEVRRAMLSAEELEEITELQRQAATPPPGDDDYSPSKVSSAVFLNTRAPALKKFITSEYKDTIVELDLSNLATRPMSDFVRSETSEHSEIARTPSFDDRACVSLCDSLEHNTTLTILNLAGNALGHMSAAAVAGVLRVNNTLRVLDLNRNDMGASSGLVVDAVVKNDTVLYVDLQGNGAATHTLHRLKNALALNQEPIAYKELIVGLVEERSEPREVRVHCPRGASEESANGQPRRGDLDTPDVPGDWDALDAVTNLFCTALARHARAQGWGSVRKPQLDDSSVPLLTSALATNLSVRNIDLAHNAITDRGVTELVNFVTDSNGLLGLGLDHNLITAKSVVQLANTVATHQSLFELSLSHNAIDESCLPAVHEALLANGNVVKFDLMHTRVHEERLEALRRLLYTNRMTVGDVRLSITAAFQNHADVTEIDLNGLVAKGMWRPEIVDIIHGLPAHSTHVTRLTIEFNDLNDNDLARMAPALGAWSSLRFVSLGANHIENIAPLCEALGNPACGIQTLDLRQNTLNVASAKALGEHLRECDQLTSLDVSRNAWASVGVSLLLGALPMNDSLQEIDVTGQGVTRDQLERVEDAIGLHYKAVQLAPTDDQRRLSAIKSPASGSAASAVRAKKRASFTDDAE